MDVLNSSTRFLRHMRYRTYLIMTTSCFLLCLLLFVAVYNFSHEGSIMALPVALAAWFFRRYEPWLYLIATILTIALINSYVYHGLLWPRSLTLAFLESSFIFCLEVIFIRFLRNIIDKSEAAEKKALLAEQQLTLAYAQQEQLLELKDQFIANVNHELRTPLTEVQGYLELLRTYHLELDETTRATFIDNAAHGCEDLQYLVDAVLDVNWAGTNPPPPEYELISVSSIIDAVLKQYDPRKLELHLIHVDIPEQITVWCDRNQLKQVVRNLISNAFKYSSPHTPIRITATSTIAWKEREEGLVRQTRICIKDAGMGIPPAEIPLLFEKFVRLKRDLAGSQRGSGLGLYLSKQLVENMGGKIWVESSGVPGEGSCFFFTLLSADPNRIKLNFTTNHAASYQARVKN